MASHSAISYPIAQWTFKTCPSPQVHVTAIVVAPIDSNIAVLVKATEESAAPAIISFLKIRPTFRRLD